MSPRAALLARFGSVSSLNPTDLSGLGAGAPAPDFTLRDQFGQDVTLSSFAGRKAVALVFFPWAFSHVCTNELTGIRDRLDEWLTFDTEVLAVSTDPSYSLRVFADTDGLNFPLLSDFWPHGAVASAYGVFDSERGVARRSSFVIDRAGIVRWSVHNQLPDGRDLEEHLAHLHHLA
jgi:mycoredoxin-dependent peroxiredoxin